VNISCCASTKPERDENFALSPAESCMSQAERFATQSSKKLSPRAYEVVMPAQVGKGEYGFMPPTGHCV